MSVYAQDYGYFFNSNNSDRKYNADSFEEWLKPFFVSGVFAGGLQVTAQDTPDMSVKVSAGYANLDGKAARWTESNTLALDTASGVYSRIDTIVLRRDNTNRAVSIEVVKGTASASPQPTAPTRNSDIYELVLAQILVGVGVTEIVASKITDKRMDSSVCGYVAATVTEIDFDQIKAQFDGWIADFEADTDEWFDAQADYFDDWFETIRGQLDEDAAGHLQIEVDDTQAMIADPYNPNTVYAAGDKCTHSGKLYEHASWGADTPAAEAWDPDHWTEIQVMGKLDAEASTRAAADTALATEISTIQGEFGYIVDGKRCAYNVAIGKYVIVRNSTMTGVTDGLYTAKKAINANTDLNDTYFTAVPNGGLNSLYDSIANIKNPDTLSPSSLDNFKSLLLTAIGTMSNKEVRDYIVVPSGSIDIFKGVTWRLMVTRGATASYFSAIAYSYSEDPIQVQYRNGSWEFTDLAPVVYGDAITIPIDVTTVRDGYEDFTAPTVPTGYTFAGYYIKTSSYRVLCRGIAGSSRCHYTVTDTGTSSVNIVLTPIFKK